MFMASPQRVRPYATNFREFALHAARSPSAPEQAGLIVREQQRQALAVQVGSGAGIKGPQLRAPTLNANYDRLYFKAFGNSFSDLDIIGRFFIDSSGSLSGGDEIPLIGGRAALNGSDYTVMSLTRMDIYSSWQLKIERTDYTPQYLTQIAVSDNERFPLPISTDQAFYARLRLSGLYVYGKVWSAGMSEEPTWQAQGIDYRAPSAGYVFATVPNYTYGFYTTDATHMDWFAIAPGAGPAPLYIGN